jgi:hypothetical protein
LAGNALIEFLLAARDSVLEFDSLRKGSVGWGGWFEFAGFNGCVAPSDSMASLECVGTGVCRDCFCWTCSRPFLKEFAMTDFRSRWLVLSAVGAALVFSPLSSDVRADDAARVVEGRKAELTVKIGGDNAESGKSAGIVISPSIRDVRGQGSGEQDVPILVAPEYDEQPEDAEPTQKSGKRDAKKSDKAPVATETASQKAREEWQKKRATERQKRQTKTQASVEPKKTGKAKNEAVGTKVSDKASDDDCSKRTTSPKDAKSAADARKKAMAAWAASETKAAAVKAKAAAAHAQSSSAKRAAGIKDSRSYREIYNSIPFSRAEYDANPGYRHQATMEIMLGQLHPIIVAPPALPRQESAREVTVRFLPSIRPGYRAWSRYPWH